ncbi:serine protease inhibitor 2-like isoform X1 [Planococcus citri]|uniref:serine protease inhibitor 2-like isoform X1 n=1 Tax=Planococcus citri TaxID=170843 RepID=UPI0031F81FE1
MYYENECYEYPKNKVLKESYTLGKIIEKLQQTTNAKLKFTNAIFYDERNTPKQYLDDIKTYYNAKTFQVSFDSSNQAEVFALVNKWLKQNVEIPSEVTAEPFNLTGVYNFQNIMTIYSSCWNIPKTLGNSFKLLKFKTPEGKINAEAFDAKETVGYYNNLEKKYQAIRLPYKNGEFAMIVVLPNEDQSLESIIGKFTENDYREVMTRVSENHENIDYAIPFLKFEGMLVNEKGTSINHQGKIICDMPSSTQEAVEINYNNEIDYKTLHIDRPFAIFVYHEGTKFILSYALVNFPGEGARLVRYGCGEDDSSCVQSNEFKENVYVLSY